MPLGTLYPVYCGRVRIEAGRNDDIFFNEGGPTLTATIPAGDYFLTGTGAANDLALAVKTALDAAPGAAQTYTVTVLISADSNQRTASVVISAAGAFALQFGAVYPASTRLDSLELGFPQSGTPSATVQTSTLSPRSTWLADQPIVNIEPDPDMIPAVELVTAGNRVEVFQGGTLRQMRTDQLRRVGSDRVWRLFSTADEQRTFQNWWGVVRDAREIELYHAAALPTLTAAELVGSYRLRGEAISLSLIHI